MLGLQASAAGLGSRCLHLPSKRLRRFLILKGCKNTLQLTLWGSEVPCRRSQEEHLVEHLRLRNKTIESQGKLPQRRAVTENMGPETWAMKSLHRYS